MESNAFVRALKFLNYHSLAKWLALLSSVAAAVLFVALIVLLAFFTDLVVNRGEIPSYQDLTRAERNAFLTEVAPPEEAEQAPARKQQVREDLHALGVSEANLKNWLAGRPLEDVSTRERALLWYA